MLFACSWWRNSKPPGVQALLSVHRHIKVRGQLLLQSLCRDHDCLWQAGLELQLSAIYLLFMPLTPARPIGNAVSACRAGASAK